MTEREEFLKTLPANVRTKLKKLQFADNLVLTVQKHGYVSELETGKDVLEKDWSYTMKSLSEKLCVSLPWLYQHLRGNVRYVYINKFNLASQSFFYQKPVTELKKYHELSSIHLNNEDVFAWFNDHFNYGIRSKVIKTDRIFGDATETVVRRIALAYIKDYQGIWDDIKPLIKNETLWNLCIKSPAFRTTSKYPFVLMRSPFATADDFKNAEFHVLREYDYASSGMNDLLSRGAGVFKAKSGKNSKMMFVFNSPRAFDTIKLSNQVYEILKDSGYKQRSVEQGIQATINLFAVPATNYFEAFPDEKPQM